jgi:hypothetical protein
MEELRELRASLRTCEEALNRSLTHSKALKAKIDFQRVSITTLESRLARERRNVEMLKDYVTRGGGGVVEDGEGGLSLEDDAGDGNRGDGVGSAALVDGGEEGAGGGGGGGDRVKPLRLLRPLVREGGLHPLQATVGTMTDPWPAQGEAGGDASASDPLPRVPPRARASAAEGAEGGARGSARASTAAQTRAGGARSQHGGGSDDDGDGGGSSRRAQGSGGGGGGGAGAGSGAGAGAGAEDGGDASAYGQYGPGEWVWDDSSGQYYWAQWPGGYEDGEQWGDAVDDVGDADYAVGGGGGGGGGGEGEGEGEGKSEDDSRDLGGAGGGGVEGASGKSEDEKS